MKIRTFIHSFLRNQTILFVIGGLIPPALNLVFLPIYSLYLSPEEFGIYAYTNAFQSIFIVLSTLSISSYLLRFYFDKGENDQKLMFGSIFLFLSIVNIIFLLFLLILMPIFVPVISSTVPFKPYFLLMIATVFFEYIYIIPQVIWRVKKQALNYVIFAASRMLLIQIFTLIMIINYDMGILGRYWANLSISAVFSLLVISTIYSHCKFFLDSKIIKEALKFSIPILPAALLGIIYNSIDKIILIQFFDLEQLGLYSVASSIAFVILVSSLGYYKAVEPVIFENFKSPTFTETIDNINKFQLYILFSISLVTVLFAKEIISAIFSAPFYDAYKYIPYFLVAFYLNATRNIVNTVLHAYKVTKLDLPIVLIALGAYLIAFNVLSKYFQIHGALFALVISSYAGLISSIFYLKRFNELSWSILLQSLLAVIILLIGFSNSIDLKIAYNTELIIKILFLMIYFSFGYKFLKNRPELIPR